MEEEEEGLLCCCSILSGCSYGIEEDRLPIIPSTLARALPLLLLLLLRKKEEQEESQQSLPTIVTNDEDGMPDESKERGGRAALIRPGGATLIRLISI